MNREDRIKIPQYLKTRQEDKNKLNTSIELISGTLAFKQQEEKNSNFIFSWVKKGMSSLYRRMLGYDTNDSAQAKV